MPFIDLASTADTCKYSLLSTLILKRGLIRRHVKDADCKDIILTEILARVIKNNLRLKLREKVKQLRKPLEEPYRR